MDTFSFTDTYPTAYKAYKQVMEKYYHARDDQKISDDECEKIFQDVVIARKKVDVALKEQNDAHEKIYKVFESVEAKERRVRL